MIELILGAKSNPMAADELIRRLEGVDWDGTLYVGYPIIAAVDEPVFIDALLTSVDHGIVVFDFGGFGNGHQGVEGVEERQNDLYAAVYQKLLSYKPLREGRGLGVEVNVITLTPDDELSRVDRPPYLATPDRVVQVLGPFRPITGDQLTLVNACVQRITTIKPQRKRTSVKREGSRGAVMKEIEREIANLDRWQKRAAIELPDGPQRIRGLAGSGKTVVLALKAAYLHARNPEWRIAVTFHTRSLYQQIKDLIRRFSFEHLNDEPDWERLRVLHSWGSRNEPGIYSELAVRSGIEPRTLRDAKDAFGYESAFQGICTELVRRFQDAPPEPVFDAFLIDEAQDLPHSFFELAYIATKDPKRIVWAYDELQNLSAYTMAPPSELFGTDRQGRPQVPDLAEERDAPRRDIILPVCYRNTPWALTVAHALGFGIYRDGGLVQFFDNPELWRAVGYDIVAGEIEPGRNVSLRRSPESSPGYFERLLNPVDGVQCHVFGNEDEQATWLAESIRRNLTEDELDLNDILVILPNPFTAKAGAGRVMEALSRHSIPAHLAGVTSSLDELFDERSVAISGIYRAKGNEAAMVYILNCDYAIAPGFELIKRRNILFTGVTRSRAWVRLCGCGTAMEAVVREVDEVRRHGYQLQFQVPTPEELQRLRRIHRDRTPSERAKIKKATEGTADLLEMLERGDLTLQNLPPDLRERIQKLLAAAQEHDR